MAIRFKERAGSPDIGYSPMTLTQRWVLGGIEDDATAYAYALGLLGNLVLHPSGALLYRQDIQIKHAGFQLYYFEVPYGQQQKSQGSGSLSFDTQGGTVHIGVSKQTIAAFGSGAATTDHKQSIGVTGPDKEPEGADVVIPVLKLTMSFSHPQGIVTLSQIKNLAGWTGQVNSDTFLTFNPGEVLFLGCTGKEGTDQPTSVDYHFACQQNLTGLSIGGISGISKKGHELYWIQYKPGTANNSGTRVPKAVYVERVYDTIPMATCLGFGG